VSGDYVVLSARSGIGVLFATGYAHALDGDAHDNGPSQILYKPYYRRELAQKIRAALDQAGAPDE
jgi:hypothetical protein